MKNTIDTSRLDESRESIRSNPGDELLKTLYKLVGYQTNVILPVLDNEQTGEGNDAQSVGKVILFSNGENEFDNGNKIIRFSVSKYSDVDADINTEMPLSTVTYSFLIDGDNLEVSASYQDGGATFTLNDQQINEILSKFKDRQGAAFEKIKGRTSIDHEEDANDYLERNLYA